MEATTYPTLEAISAARETLLTAARLVPLPEMNQRALKALVLEATDCLSAHAERPDPPTPTTPHSLINEAMQAITDLDEASERMRAIIRNAIPVGYPRHDALVMLETATGLVMAELQRLSREYAAMGHPAGSAPRRY